MSNENETGNAFDNLDTDAIYKELSKGGSGDGEFPLDLVGKRLLWKSKAATMKIKDDRAELGVKFQPSTTGGYVRNPAEAAAAEKGLVDGAAKWLNVRLPGLVSKMFKVEKDDKDRQWCRMFFMNIGYRITEATAKKYGVPEVRPESPRRVESGAKVYQLGGRNLTTGETRAAFARCDAWDAAAILDLVACIGQKKKKDALDGYWIVADAHENGEWVNIKNQRSASETSDLGPGETIVIAQGDDAIPF